MSEQWIPHGPAILFAPADKPDRFSKAADRADMVIVDLEDGCRPELRAEGRGHILAAVGDTLDPERTIVRINPVGTSDAEADIRAVASSSARLVMVPKAESAEEIDRLADELPHCRLIALIETPRGVLAASQIAACESVVGLFWGAEDLTAAMGGLTSRRADGTYRDVARVTRVQVQLAAAAHGKAALDAVHVDIHDAQGLQDEATDAVSLGFAASCCIHPSQVEIIRAAYRPTDQQLAWARGLLAEAENNRGAFSHEGRMVDEPLFRQARSIVRRAQ